jgi:hypothetical protein
MAFLSPSAFFDLLEAEEKCLQPKIFIENAMMINFPLKKRF